MRKLMKIGVLFVSIYIIIYVIFGENQDNLILDALTFFVERG